ncbi:MAG: NADP-dependent oxidoreductase [Sandaracinaceae bacterium]
MRAMLIRRYGDPDVFELGEIDTPRPGPGEVRVRVRASSVNPIDTYLRSGGLKLFVRLALPAVLGVDVAGVVDARGEGATKFAEGDRVFAFTGIDRGGGYGEHAIVPERALARIPDALDWAEAGTVPGVGATAYEAFTVHAPLERGARVFINGGAGGVGTYAIQIAKAFGADVTTTCSAAKAELLTSLGADHVLDYTKTDPFAAGRDRFDVVLNGVRGAPMGALRALLRSGGTLVDITGDPLQAVVARVRNLVSRRRTVTFLLKTDGALLDGVARLIDAGSVRPVVERTYGWDELADAHRRVETGRVAGKVAVLAPDRG